MTAEPTAPAPPALRPEIPAATLVIFRRAPAGGPPELLMLVRSQTMSFAGGMAVFPGGRVDPADRELAGSLGGPLDADEAAHRIAAIRETLEETGLALGLRPPVGRDRALAMRAALLREPALGPALAAAGATLDLDTLIPFARWCPRGMTSHRIYDTRFYLHDLGTGAVEVAVDATENTRLFWTTAAGALAAADAGQLSLIFPTRRNLERLALFPDFAAARAQAEATPIRTIVPQEAVHDGEPALTIPGDLGYPVTVETFATLRRG